MLVIAKFYWDCGRMGSLDGLFVTDKKDLEEAYGKELYFGEVLGKHSEIYGTFKKEDIEIVSEDQEFIAKFQEIIGSGTVSGFNPLEYLPEFDEEEE